MTDGVWWLMLAKCWSVLLCHWHYSVIHQFLCYCYTMFYYFVIVTYCGLSGFCSTKVMWTHFKEIYWRHFAFLPRLIGEDQCSPHLSLLNMELQSAELSFNVKSGNMSRFCHLPASLKLTKWHIISRLFILYKTRRAKTASCGFTGTLTVTTRCLYAKLSSPLLAHI